MTTIDDILQALNRSDTLELCEQAINEDANVVVATLKEQLERGEGGDELMPFYSPRTRNQGRIRLYDTGDFYAGIGATSDNGLLFLASNDEKSNMLEEIYAAENPLKLNERGISELHDVLQETAARLMIDKLSM